MGVLLKVLNIAGENDHVVRLERFNEKKEMLINREKWIDRMLINVTSGFWNNEVFIIYFLLIQIHLKNLS